MCLRIDYEYSGSKLPRCQGLPEAECIGISGYTLNCFLSSFLLFYRSTAGDESLVVHWNEENGNIFPVLFQQDAANLYVGIWVKQPGVLNYKTIGREQCEMQKNRIFLKLIKDQPARLEKKLLALESEIQDNYTEIAGASPSPYSVQYRMILMSLMKGIRGVEDKFCNARNCLLLFFAHEVVLYSLCKCAKNEENASMRRSLLNFLGCYCSFIQGLKTFYQSDMLSTETFRRCFLEYWKVDLNQLIDEGLVSSSSKGTASSGIVPIAPFLTVMNFKEVLRYCFQSATYEKRTRLMKNLHKTLADHLECDDQEVSTQLGVIEDYIKNMEALRKEERKKII